MDAYFRTLMQAMAFVHQPADARYVLYFSPRQCLYAEQFFELFPDGHIIQVIRHPAAYYASVKSHNRYYDLAGSRAVWRIFFLNALEALRRAWPYHVQELVAAPEPTLRTLCGRLGIPFDDVLLTPSLDGQPWRGDSNFGQLRGVRADVADR